MATFVVDESGGLFGAMAYARLHPNTINYLQQQTSQTMGNLTANAMNMFNNVSNVFKSFDYDSFIRTSRAAVRAIGNMWQHEGIMPIDTIGGLQQASLEMQRWLMAEPTLRAAFIDQRCDGYHETYIDKDPGVMGVNHYDYRRATNHVFMPVGNTMVASSYMEPIRDGDRELHVTEQADISIAWHYMREAMLANKDDPSSRTNSRL